ncbi:MAG: hemerythrin family protein [Rhodospirillum sp.]|nr:hemerythrin family protein [Rhodospirillum sp.]MCF8490123.1 hemerythrin family protein [Rhodospirillum sp.]MCF8501586.1 hemerythrin family protein [Rhodospirillum sp.]
MLNIVWSQAFRIGVRGIDESHADHLDFLNLITTLIRAKEDTSVILSQVERLYLDLESHHQDEDRLMIDLGYPELTAHQAVHTFLLDELKVLARHFVQGNDASAMLRAASTMGHLLLDHIIRHDLAILTFMQGRGLTETRLSMVD